MKILLSGYHNPHYLTITEYLERAIVRLGHDLVITDDRAHIIPGRLRKRLGFLHKFDLWNINRRILLRIKQTRSSVAIITGGHRVVARTIQKINSAGIIFVLLTIDAPLNFQPIIRVAPYYKYINP